MRKVVESSVIGFEKMGEYVTTADYGREIPWSVCWTWIRVELLFYCLYEFIPVCDCL